MFRILDRKIGSSHPPYIIAELSANHNGTIEQAKKIIEVAAKAGADAVKLQTYTADTITIDHNGPDFCIEDGLWAGKSLYELYDEAHTPWDWHKPLFDYAHSLGITIFSTPFDDTAVDFLEDLGAPAYKIASFEVVDIPLIKKVASTGKPMIISTGMASLTEIAEAVEAAQIKNSSVALLHCISAYPAPVEDANLATIADLARRFNLCIGLSDHTLGTTVAVAAVAMGANILEKHVTLRRADGGPDSAFSLEPHELKRLVDDVRVAWAARGKVNYEIEKSERDNLRFRRSIYVVRDMKVGEVFTSENIKTIRPGFGLLPKEMPHILGCKAKRDLSRGSPLTWDDISKEDAK